MLTLGDGWSAAQWALGAWLLAQIPTPAPAGGGRPERERREPATRRVSVIVPARDEAASLPHLLASLAAQTEPAGEVIVVDDGSRDDTAALAAAAGVTVVPAGEPPPGWAGKPWACHVGSEAASGDVLVFLDADVTLAPDGLGRLAARSGRAGRELLSV
ncbi:MAG: glycosyltransferase, partial [Acidimicrobiales bacterium]